MKITDSHVFFWGDEPFTNFTPCPNLKYVGLDWKSTEQAFMWIKAVEFKDFDTARRIREANSPKEAKKLGRSVKNFDVDHWSSVSYNYMKCLVDIKFQTNPEFLGILLDPKFDGKVFVEASPFDRIWGIGFREEEAAVMGPSTQAKLWGKNRLGQILTELRDQYTKQIKAMKKVAKNAGDKTQKEEKLNAHTTGLVGQSDSR